MDHLPSFEKYEYPEKQTIIQASKNINLKLQIRGFDELAFFTVKPPHNKKDIYEHDKNVINVINSLISELELYKRMNDSQEKISDKNTREKNYWKESAGRLEIARIKNERRIRDLEVESLKFKFTIDELSERKKGVESRVRNIKNEWKTYRNEVSRQKRKFELDRDELIDKIKLKYNPKFNRRNTEYKHKLDNLKHSEIITDLLKEKDEARHNFLKIYGFNKNLYNCLENLKASDGNCPINNSFLATDDELHENNISGEISSKIFRHLDSLFVKILNDIRNEPFGSNDTFRFKKIGVDRKSEIYLLKEQLNTLQDNYDKVLNTMNERKE
ncbi:hypothetical protein C6P40_004642 [Pichia californica]|uniref:Uncharacterized protein n=1 Tax=Pichia californica TaxID=460514 RepID=A0A9P6WMC6_9ASCO|nr:hypothetical protein C6P42_003459 [[Candida] californica]KAG0689697.1 hypothetical protein C6P40_004642 [[Candida] californica]